MRAIDLERQATELRNQGKALQAIGVYLKAKAAYKAQGDAANAAGCQHMVGVCYKVANNLEHAIAALKQAADEYRSIKILYGEARVERDMGIMFAYHDRFGEAETHLTSSHDLLAALPGDQSYMQSVTGMLCRNAELGITLAKLGMLYTRMDGRRGEAEGLITRGLELIRGVGHPFYEATAMMHLGDLYLGLGHRGRGLSNLLGCLGLLYEHDMQAEHTRRLAQIWGLLAHAYLAFGNHVVASHFAQKSAEVIEGLTPDAQTPLLKDIRFDELKAKLIR